MGEGRDEGTDIVDRAGELLALCSRFIFRVVSTLQVRKLSG